MWILRFAYKYRKYIDLHYFVSCRMYAICCTFQLPVLNIPWLNITVSILSLP